MILPRMLQTTLMDPEGKLNPASFLMIPARINVDFETVKNALEFTSILDIDPNCTSGELLKIVGGVLVSATAKDFNERFEGYDFYDNPYQLAFLEEVTFGIHIVVEHSDPFLSTLFSIFKSESGPAIGACVGFFAGIGYPPLLLITVPFGILLCSTAVAIGLGIQQGLPEKVSAFLRNKPGGATI